MAGLENYLATRIGSMKFDIPVAANYLFNLGASPRPFALSAWQPASNWTVASLSATLSLAYKVL
jgi:hypothetical protein